MELSSAGDSNRRNGKRHHTRRIEAGCLRGRSGNSVDTRYCCRIAPLRLFQGRPFELAFLPIRHLMSGVKSTLIRLQYRTS